MTMTKDNNLTEADFIEAVIKLPLHAPKAYVGLPIIDPDRQEEFFLNQTLMNALARAMNSDRPPILINYPHPQDISPAVKTNLRAGFELGMIGEL